MKFLLLVFVLVLLICGCKKSSVVAHPKIWWQYKVVEIENYEHDAYDAAVSEMQTNSEKGLDDVRISHEFPGSFDLNKLDEIGRDGWELVSAVPQTETEKDEGVSFVRTGKIILIFKRPLD